MVEWMVAMPTFDLIAGALWLGLLTAALLVRSLLAWGSYRHAAQAAKHAARLAEATARAELPTPIPIRTSRPARPARATGADPVGPVPAAPSGLPREA